MVASPSSAPGHLGPRVLRWVTLVVLVHSALLVLSGVLLVFFYRPTAAQAWEDIYQLQASVEFGVYLRRAHRWLAWLWLPAALALAFVAGTERFRRGVLASLAAFGIGLAALFTGYLLPWDQLALWEVRAGQDTLGYLPILFGDDVRFVLADGVEVSVQAIRAYFFVHLVVGVIACAAPLVAVTLSRRRG